jgi:predicted secreted protein
MLIYSVADNGQEVDVPLNREFQISLAESTLSGYVWDRESDGEPACALVSEASPPPAGRALGGARQRIFRFRTQQPGLGVIRLVQHRRWSQQAPHSETFILNVRVS